MKIYVGNLSFEVSEEELQAEFASFGEVTSVSIPMDRYSGRPRGFAFIEMPTVSEGQAAINSLDGKILKDRALKVDTARPRSNYGSGGSYREGRDSGFSSERRRRY